MIVLASVFSLKEPGSVQQKKKKRQKVGQKKKKKIQGHKCKFIPNEQLLKWKY